MNLRQLIELQEQDNHILRLQDELKEIPRQIELQKGRLNQISNECKAAEASIQVCLKQRHSLELDLKTKEDSRIKLQSQQFTVKTNEQFKAIQNEIAAMGKAVSQMEDKILESMEAAETAKKELNTKKTAFEQENQRFIEAEKKLLAEQSRLDNLMVEAKTKRDSMQSQLPSSLKSVYDRIRLKHPENAIVTIQNDICQGCFMKLPAQISHQVRKGDKFIQCENCSRILYYREDDTAL